MILAVLAACGAPSTVQPLVDARAAEVAVAASPGVRLGVASGSLGAWLCSYDQTDLRELARDPNEGTSTDTGTDDTGTTAEATEPWSPTLDAPAGFASNLAVTEPGAFLFNADTGVTTITWVGSLDGEQALTIDVVIDTPTQEFTLLYRDPDEDADLTVSGVVTVDTCAVVPQVLVELDLEDGDDELRVVLPGSDGVPLEWDSGVFAPKSGTASWSTGSGVSKLSWQADDSGSIAAESWPGTASSADWTAAATVSIARPD